MVVGENVFSVLYEQKQVFFAAAGYGCDVSAHTLGEPEKQGSQSSSYVCRFLGCPHILGEMALAVESGLDHLLKDPSALRGAGGIVAVTNHSALTSHLVHITTVLSSKFGERFRAAVSPEHGLYGEHREGEAVSDDVDPLSGRPVYSWYSSSPGFKEEWFDGVDTLVYDIQDGGVRYHTHLSVLRDAILFCASHGIRLVVLDRPNPIRGDVLEGNIPENTSIVCAWRIPIRYALTAGELARLIASEAAPGLDLEVVPLSGWRRNMWYDQTGMVWVPLSPNTPTLTTSTVYPGTCLFEGTTLSVGRGTTTPFELVGAPWLDCVEVAGRFNSLREDGVRCRPTFYVPRHSRYADQKCRGVHLHVVDRDSFRPVRAALKLLRVVLELHGEQKVFGDNWKHFDLLTGSDTTRKALIEGCPPEEIFDSWRQNAERFKQAVEKHRIYP